MLGVLNRAPNMMQPLGTQVCGVRKFCRIKSAERYYASVKLYLRNPFLSSFAPPSAQKSGSLVAGVSRSMILCIDVVRDITKICNLVVVSDAINVVNEMQRPLTSHIEPRKPADLIASPIDFELSVAAPESSEGWRPRASIPAVHASREYAGLRVVVKKFAQTRGGKIGSSHEALQLRIGQRLAAIRTRLRASLFSPRHTANATVEYVA